MCFLDIDLCLYVHLRPSASSNWREKRLFFQRGWSINHYVFPIGDDRVADCVGTLSLVWRGGVMDLDRFAYATLLRVLRIQLDIHLDSLAECLVV